MTHRTRAHRRFFALVCVGLFGLLFATACGDAQRDAGDTKIAARVNGVEFFDVDVRVAMAAARFSNQELTYDQAREQLIGEVLMRAEADALDISFDERDVAKRVDSVAEGAGSRDALAAALEAQGLSLEQYTDRVRAALLVERLSAEKFVSTFAGKHEARAYFARHRAQFTRASQVDLGDISVKTEPMADNVRQLILKGQSFVAAARQFSTDGESRQAGGRLGWVTVDSLPVPADRAIAALDRGELSEPVGLMGGWHVFKLYGRRAARRFTFAEVGDEIIAELTQRRRAAALREWLEIERRDADIVIDP